MPNQNKVPPPPPSFPDEEYSKAPPAPVLPGVPHNRESEEAVVGAVLINPDMFIDLDFLRPVDFYIHRHRWIWEAYDSLAEQKIPIDLLTLAEELGRKGRLDEIGGRAFLTALINQVPSSLNAVAYARIIEAHSIRRRMITTANDIASLAYDEDQSLEQVLGKYEAIVAKPPDIASRDDTVSADVVSIELLSDIGSGMQLGVSVGWPYFDSVNGLGGFPLGGVSLLIGDSSFGKTAWCLQACEQVAMSKRKALYFGYESPNKAMVSRRLFGNTGISSKAMKTASLTAAEEQILSTEAQEYQKRFKDGNLLFNTRARSLRQIGQAIRRHRPAFVVIDQFRQISDRTGDNITMNFLENFAMLKWFATEYNCAILTVHGTTPSESRTFFKNASSVSNKMAGKNHMPDINGISWATDLKFLADVMLILVPDVRNKLAGMGKNTTLDILIWIMKDRDGDRFAPTYWKYDLGKQWWVDVVPTASTMQSSGGSSVVGGMFHGNSSGQSAPPPPRPAPVQSQVPMPMGGSEPRAVEEYAFADDDPVYLEEDLDQGELSDD